MTAVYIVIALLGLYVIFIVLPSVVMFLVTFGRKDTDDIVKIDVKRKYYQKHKAEIEAACAQLEKSEHEEVHVCAFDGTKLSGIYYDCRSQRTAVIVHGYAAIPETALCFQAADLIERGFNVLMISQRGHGRSGGRFTGLGLLECEDLRKWIGLALEKEPEARILLYGSSMGCASVAYGADSFDPEKIAGMVLDCGFTSIYGQLSDDAKRRKLPAPLIMPYMRLLAKLILHIDIKEDVRSHLKATRIPAFFVHGEADGTVYAINGHLNYEACASKKASLFPKECGHCACYVKYRGDILDAICGMFDGADVF